MRIKSRSSIESFFQPRALRERSRLDQFSEMIGNNRSDARYFTQSGFAFFLVQIRNAEAERSDLIGGTRIRPRLESHALQFVQQAGFLDLVSEFFFG